MKNYMIYLGQALALTALEYYFLFNTAYTMALICAGGALYYFFRLAVLNHNLFVEALEETPKDKEVKRKIKDWLGR